MSEDRPMYDKIVDDVKDYISLRSDSMKLRATANLSVITGGAIAMIICMLFCLLALMIFSVAIIYGISLLINSILWALLIVGVLYVVIGVMVFYRRDKFINMMVRLFSGMFFEKSRKTEEQNE